MIIWTKFGQIGGAAAGSVRVWRGAAKEIPHVGGNQSKKSADTGAGGRDPPPGGTPPK